MFRGKVAVLIKASMMMLMYKKYLKSESGIGLVETLIAVSLAVIVVTSLVSLAVFALRNSRQSSYTAQATQLAQNQLELLRSYRDSSNVSWATFTNLATSPCNYTFLSACQAPTGGCSYPITNPVGSAPTAGQKQSTPFTYTMNLTSVSGVYRAGVVVHWSIGGKSQCVYNYTDFTNWRGK